MKQFLKFFTASCLGTFVSLLLVVIAVVIWAVVAISSSMGDEEKSVEENSIFRLKLNGQLVERHVDDYYSVLFDDTSLPTLGLNDIISGIEKAKNDDKIKGMYVDCGVFTCGTSSARAIRNALLDFKESGKFVVSNAGIYTQGTYYIASAADKIIINPVGSIDWHGLSSEQFFYKNLLDKLGVEVELVKVGKFKSFAEKYTCDSISPENAYQIQEYLQSTWHTMLTDISASRHISIDSLNALADSAICYAKTEKQVACGLVDAMMYENEVLDYLASLVDVEKTEDLKFVTVNQLKNNSVEKSKKNKIAVVYAVGSIDNSATDDEINSEKLSQLLVKIAKDDDVKAVVLRINSPGGSAYGAEQIWNALQNLKTAKPLVVSMGDCAASGGYYIACNAERIFAEPTTLTGSIGIFGIIPNFEGTLQKIGVKTTNIKTNEKSDMLSPTRKFTPSERALLQSYVDNGYELFVKRCANGRGMTTDVIKAIAEGRVWTGEKALKIGLVDELGGLNEAIKYVTTENNIKDYEIAEYPELDDMMTQIMNSLECNVQTSIVKSQLGENYVHYQAIEQIKNMQGVQALLPIGMEVK